VVSLLSLEAFGVNVNQFEVRDTLIRFVFVHLINFSKEIPLMFLSEHPLIATE